jgi:adenosine deaminase
MLNRERMISRTLPRRLAALLLAALPALGAPYPARAQGGAREAATAAAMERLRGSPPRLYAFLREMPKGGDLHMHLSGAVYAESFIRWAVEDSLCISRRDLAIIRQPCTLTPDTVAASAAYADQGLYDALIDAFSMRNWNPARPLSGHDQFFATFDHFTTTPRRVGDEVAEAQSRAAAGRVAYLEVMQTPASGVAIGLGSRVLGDSAFAPGRAPDFAAMRQALLANGGTDAAVAAARENLSHVEARRDTALGCLPGRQPEPGCAVQVRWLYQVLRGLQPQQVLAMILTGFELAKADPRVVGFNLVMPEDGRVSMHDFDLHMRWIDYLHQFYPQVKITLHAGELAPGLVPPEGLRFHIRESVELGHASRIGHGVDVLHEDRPEELLREMARRGVMVEIALTSNDGILGVRGRDHPLSAYRAHGVPVALATDDEGVARSEMTREWVKAVEEQGLGYRDLKTMARTSLEHAFVEGAGIWSDGRRFTPVAACAPASGGFAGASCCAVAARSTKARLQRDLELAFRDFEANHASDAP